METTAAQPALRVRNKGLVTLRVADVLENPANFQEHPPEQDAALGGAVAALGWYGYPDVFELPDGRHMLVDGALRRQHLIDHYGPDAAVEFNVTDFTPEEAELALATKDPLAKMATVNGKALEALLAGIPAVSPELDYLFGRLRDQAFEATIESISNAPAAETVAPGDGEPVPSEALGKSFINLSAPCTKEQHTLILDAVNHAKQNRKLSTTAEALAVICSEYMAGARKPPAKKQGGKGAKRAALIRSSSHRCRTAALR